MWTRAELKSRVKDTMRAGYIKMFIVGLVLSFVTSGGGGSSGRNSGGTPGFDITNNQGHMFSDLPDFFPVVVRGVIGFIFIAILVAFAIRVMLGYPLEVGCRKFFLGTTNKDFDMGKMGYSFKGDRYWDIVSAMLYRGVIVFLWSLLLIVPGIIKAYAYKMVPYILAENPSIGTARALEISNDMTNGQKMDIFILDLSFIGWYLLGALLFGLGVYFVNPYYYGTGAELYTVLKAQALEANLCRPEEFEMPESI